MFLFSDCKQIRKFLFGDVPQNSFKIWETTETKPQQNINDVWGCAGMHFILTFWGEVM
jgi:hypothetical protein